MNKIPLFEIRDLFFFYKDQPALSEINLKISQGELITFIGANGSGKSTLLKIMDGLYFPKMGFIKYQGKILNQEYFEKEENNFSFRKNIGLVFQDPDVQLFSPTVWDELMFAPIQMGLEKKSSVKRVESVISRMKIEHLKDRNPYNLSGGEKRKVALASVMTQNPSVWLFDEPTDSLDPESVSNFIDFIQKLKEEGKTVICATHDLDIISDISERVLVFSNSHNIIWDGTPDKLVRDQKLLMKFNLIHRHRHKHLGKVHKHIHLPSGRHLH